MNNLMKKSMVGALIGVLLTLSQTCRQNETPPVNVLFILVDDLGWNDLGVYGQQFYESPNIDKWAGESIIFSQAYSAASICSPSRAAILTGRHPARFPITDWIPGQNPGGKQLIGPQDLDALPLEEKTLAEIFHQAGYQTFFAGKWHLGGEGNLPTDQGFTVNKGGHEKGSPPGGYYVPYKNPYLEDGPKGEYLPHRLTTETIDFIKGHQDEPFFAFLSYYTVHTPIQANQTHVPHFEEKAKSLKNKGIAQTSEEGAGITVLSPYSAAYASMGKAMDDEVGRMIKYLKDAGIYNQTLIVFTSDNGGLSTLEHNRKNPAPTSVRPLRGGKGWLYEGGIRVPLIIKPPNWIGKRPAHIDIPVVGQDLFSTILETVFPDSVDLSKLDGLPLNSLWDTKNPQGRATLFWHYPHYHGSGWTPGTAIRSGNWKLIYWYETDHYELYNLERDLEEKNNLVELNPVQFSRLKDTLALYLQEYGAAVPIQNPALE